MEAAINTLTQSEGLRETITETQFSKNGCFLGTVTALKINGERRKNELRTLNLFVRCASDSYALRMTMPVGKIYRVELHVYKNIFPNFKLFEIENSVFPTSFSSRFYHGLADDKGETLIFENLSDLGYKIYPNNFTMDDDHCSIVMAKFGRLHALSFALRHHKPEVFKELAEPMREDLFAECFNITVKKSVVNLNTQMLEGIDKITNYETYQALESFILNMDSIYEEMTSICLTKYFVVSHGDCWCNSFMFKYGNVDIPHKPTSLRLVDFQMSRLGLPIMDLTYFLYSCSSKKVLNQFELYLDLYYKSFSDHLCKLDCDPAEVYSYSTFRLHWQNYAKFALFIVPAIIQVTATNNDNFDSIDLVSLAESKIDFSDMLSTFDVTNNELFHDRMMFVITHLVKNKLL